MRASFSKLCIAILWLLAVVPVMSADESSPIPKQFSVAIGGFFGASYELELHGGKLAYSASRAGRTNFRRSTITPNAAQWREFRLVLDGLKVWQWRAAYRNGQVKDGTQWSLDIAYADHGINSKGDNSYPNSTGRPNGKIGPTTAFKGYLLAVEKLISGKTFR